jgi:hypothetical protein
MRGSGPGGVSDSQEFLAQYRQAVERGADADDIPGWIRRLYSFESCLKHQDGKQVYLVLDRRTGGLAILRVMSLDGPASMMPKRDQEYAILSGLDFAGVPKVFGSFVEGRRSYLVREYFPGRPLDSLLRQGQLDTSSIVGLSRQLCAILGHLHGLQPPVVHRDIKPGNIIVMPDGRLGLTDFGIARVYKEQSDSDTSYEGTLHYAPPEQFGYSQSTPLSDIYALGIVMLCMATGSPVRQGIAQRVHDKALRAIIERCVAFDPKDRFQDVAELDARLERIGPKRRNRRRLGLAAAAGLSLALGVGVGADALLGDPLGIIPSRQAEAEVGKSGQWLDGEAGHATRNPNPNNSPANPERARGFDLGEALFPNTLIGNLGGNIVQGGFAVEADQAIYLAFDDQIWELDRQGQPTGMVIDAIGARSLNYHRGVLYYASDYGVYGYDPATGKQRQLSTASADYLHLMNGELYYSSVSDNLRLYALALDGSGDATLASASDGNCRNLSLGFQAYLTSGDQAAIVVNYPNDIATMTPGNVMDGVTNASHLSAFGIHIYFCDLSGEGVLAGMHMGGADYMVLAPDPCTDVVACPFGVFYILPATGQLSVYRFSDGSRITVLPSGVDNYCLAGEWVFYTTDGQPGLWMVRLNGSDRQPVSL